MPPRVVGARAPTFEDNELVMRGGVVLGCALVGLLVGETEARADMETARRHFEAGKKLRDAGDCTRAIAEFERSVAADESIGGHYNLGYCHEQLLHRQDAYEAYKRAQHLASVKKDERLREISGALAALLQTPHIRLVLPQPLPDGLRIEVDGRLVPETFHAAETVVFIERASRAHSVRVTAPGYEERRALVENRQVRPIELRRSIETTTTPAPIAPPPDGGSGSTWQHWTGLGVGATGVALFTVGSAMFVSYLIEERDLGRQYDAANRCDKRPGKNGESDPCSDPSAEAVRLNRERSYMANEDDAKKQAPLILGTTIGGALLVGGGLVLYLTAPRPRAHAATDTRVQVLPILGTTTRGVALTGTF